MSHGDRALTRGILIYLSAWVVIPVMDGGAKYLSEAGYPTMLIVWGRFFFNFILMLPLAAITRTNVFAPPPRVGLQIVRAIALVGATFLFYTGLGTMALADALAAYFVYPLIVTALAPLFLGEVPGLRRWIAVGMGFAGSLLVIQPGGGMNEGVPHIIAAAVCFAIYNILTRKLSGKGNAWQTLAFQMLVGSLLLSPAAVLAWTPLNWEVAGIFLIMAAASALGHYLIIRAYDYAPASVLAPFSYFEIVSATIIGLVVFGDFPAVTTWAGVAVIVASGVYISVRERVAGRKP